MARFRTGGTQDVLRVCDRSLARPPPAYSLRTPSPPSEGECCAPSRMRKFQVRRIHRTCHGVRGTDCSGRRFDWVISVVLLRERKRSPEQTFLSHPRHARPKRFASGTQAACVYTLISRPAR